jgi:PHP family Zn ribbon phosphoesterase
MLVTADFHNHSCLSPCGSLEMSPARLASGAAARGLQLVALTDHNSALNTPAWQECARRAGLVPLFGMEATSAEEVHVLCLFGTVAEALDFGAYLKDLLLPVPYKAETLGDQVVVDADENVLDLPETYFGSSLLLGYDELCEQAKIRGALLIPAHIDRPMFGAISQLGFLPEGPYDAVELMRPADVAKAGPYTITTGSDAHYPEHIGRRPFKIELPDNWINGEGLANVSMIREALAGKLVRLLGSA